MAERMFVAEGPKVVADLMRVSTPRILAGTNEWLNNNSAHIIAETEIINVSEEELSKISFLKHPQSVMGVFPFFNNVKDGMAIDKEELCLALDGVQDPGNLGTIIRIADWFGIEKVFCSHDTADVYNPKVVQATMGSIARVRLEYTDLQAFIRSLPAETAIYGTMLNGDDIYESTITRGGLLVMGNEGNGISPEIAELVNRKLLIPNYPKGRHTADSLNVAIATAITCAEFRRRTS